jgi:hypothetical protein
MINRCANSPFVGIISFCSFSFYFAAATTTHHSLMMLLPGRRDTTTIWHGGYRANGSDANDDAHRHLVRRVLPIAWYKTLRILT